MAIILVESPNALRAPDREMRNLATASFVARKGTSKLVSFPGFKLLLIMQDNELAYVQIVQRSRGM
jgi:hypothetical protein